MEKEIIDRRIHILEKEGIIFKTNVNVGGNYDLKNLDYFDAIVLCGGATKKRALPIEGADAKGVVQAMDFLKQQTKQLFNKEIESLNASLGQAEKIVRYKLVKDEWGPETGELSPTLKLRRNFIAEKYQVQIDELYRKN